MGEHVLHNQFDEPIEQLRRLSRQIDMVRQRIAENKRLIRKKEEDSTSDPPPSARRRPAAR